MGEDAKYPKRKQIRLRYFDYRQTGLYFVTICTHDRRSTLGMIRGGAVKLSPLGRLTITCWESIPEHSHGVELGLSVVMPNHLHGLIAVDSQSDPSEARRKPGELRSRSLGAIVGQFKAAVTRIGRAEGFVGSDTVWQRGFWEHIVRGQRAYERIQRYIVENPARWRYDRENRRRTADDPFDTWITEQGELPP